MGIKEVGEFTAISKYTKKHKTVQNLPPKPSLSTVFSHGQKICHPEAFMAPGG